MNNTSKPSYINGSFGKIKVNTFDDGAVLTQEKNGVITGSIALSSEDMEKLGKALFAIKKENFPSTPPQQKTTGIPFQVPNFGVPQTSSPSNYMEQEKAKHSQAYAPWTTEEEERLKSELTSGKTVPEMMELHQRGKGAIESRLKKLGLV